MNNSHLESGSIIQPEGNWVRYDFSRATIGDVRLSGKDDDGHELLDYFRFAETEFEGFNFSAHRGYLERNDWNIHRFAGGGDYDFAAELTPGVIETTYLNASNSARAQGDRDAAMEFSIKKAYYRRKKNIGHLSDATIPVTTRIRKVGDVAGNFAWYQVCGYGYRLWRILAVSAVVVFFWGLAFAFLSNSESAADKTGTTIEGLSSIGQLTTPEGAMILLRHQYYSLVTFTTVGYGDINPLGPT
ncbi:MAG: potassium channel family protein, partial [Halobacteria archaeon]|nr:potassium channel family protein [Halobacteria archaeon]